MIRNLNIAARLDAIAEANTQFHWGSVVEKVEEAASHLRALQLNPVLASGLEAKANRMRTIATFLCTKEDMRVSAR